MYTNIETKIIFNLDINSGAREREKNRAQQMKTISHLKMHADGMRKEEDDDEKNFITISHQRMRAYQ